MANNPYVNKVEYGGQTLIDLTNDTATEGDVVSGKTFHSADGQQRTGTRTDVTPTSITPSASAPSMAANGVYKPTVAGYAINTYSSITPSASAPAMEKNTFYKAAVAGYAINTYSSKTPSATGTSFSAGFNKMSTAGYAYSSQQTVNYDLVVIGVNETKTFTMNNGVFILRTTSDDVIMYMGFVANGVLTNKINKTTYVSVSYATSTKKITAKTKGIEVYLSIFMVN